ncbi:MAG: hypothetical protein ABSB74_06245 [Tepidisphaeraceae bacterium]
MDNCDNCGAAIGKLETPNVWQDHVVCAHCYAKLAIPVAHQLHAPASTPTLTRLPPSTNLMKWWVPVGIVGSTLIVMLVMTTLGGRHPNALPVSPASLPSAQSSPSSPPLALLTEFAKRFVQFTQSNEQDYQNQLIAIEQRGDDQLGNGTKDSVFVICHLLSADWRRTDSLTAPVVGEVVFTEEVGTVTGLHGINNVTDRYTVDFSYENRNGYNWNILSIRKVCQKDEADPSQEGKETMLDTSWGITPLIKAEGAQLP